MLQEDNLADMLLDIEVVAARLEGVFLADPEIGMLWRAPAMLGEACRSVMLEDIHVFEGDVLARAWENHSINLEDARGAYALDAMLPFLASPSDMGADPVAVLGRIVRVAAPAGPSGIDSGLVERSALPNASAVIVDLAADIGEIIGAARSPVLGALHAAMRFRSLSEARLPSAERLVFMAAEHALRRLEAIGAPVGVGRTGAILPPVRARWICLPSVALTTGRFQTWSPGTVQGTRALLGGLQKELDRTLGMVPVLRRWRDMATAYAHGRHGRSRIRDLVTLAIGEPVLTTARIRDALDISPRSAHNLVDEAASEGLLTCLTPRATYRVWATPFMAARLQMRASKRPRAATSLGTRRSYDAEGLKRDEVHSRPSQPSAESSAVAIEELEKAMAKADAILARYAGKYGGSSEPL